MVFSYNLLIIILNCNSYLKQYINFTMVLTTIFSHYPSPIPEKNKKRDVRNWYNQEPGTSVDHYRQQEIPLDMDRRGDIPIMSGDCEGM